MSEIPYSLPGAQSVTIRPLRLEDVPSIDVMHDRVSQESMYCRYFTPHKPSLTSLLKQAHLSSSRGAGFVAVLQNPPQEIVGFACYVCSPDNIRVAEPALLIEDRFQGQGLGRAMMDHLVREAQANAVDYFEGYVLPANQRILRFLEHSGLPMERHYRDGLFEVWLDLGFEQSIPIAIPAELSPIGGEVDPAILANA